MHVSRLVAALVVTLAVALPAQAAPDAQSQAITIRLVSITTQVVARKDVAPKQRVSKGDVFWQRSQLLNAVAQFGKPKGALVGSDTGTLTVVSATAVHSTGTAVLPGGTIRFAGRASGTSGSTIPVTGGTGRYAGARGELALGPLDARGARTSNVYRLTLRA
jgi:hypothetical protein